MLSEKFILLLEALARGQTHSDGALGWSAHLRIFRLN
jgi:hypothetical protein